MNRTKGQKSLFRADITTEAATMFFSGFESEFGSWDAVVSRDCDPREYQSIGEFLPAYWTSESWSKVPVEIPGIDREKEAMNRFHAAEELCQVSNDRLVDFFSRPNAPAMRRLIGKARRYLVSLLSGITRTEVMESARWGPGASTSLPRRRATAQHKWQFASHVTVAALPWFSAFCRYGNVPFTKATIVEGNRVTLVPKNAKTDRVIAIEPDWNMFFQLGLGAAIRRRARSVGLLFPEAQERNRELARLGSKFPHPYATIDLRSASDGVSLALCELLLPQHLYRLILELRSHYGSVKGETVFYEKVSSMGNGFTFELETVLFWALARAVVGDGVVAVYGDDIIVPNQHCDLVVELLQFCGFVVNTKKTFSHGLFRESCGGHYFNGTDVTPPYFRKRLSHVSPIISAANAISLRCRTSSLLAYRLRPLHTFLKDRVPRKFWGLEGTGDVCLHVPFDQAVPKWDVSRQCLYGSGVFRRRKLKEAPEEGALAEALWRGGEQTDFPGEEEVYYVGKWYSYG